MKPTPARPVRQFAQRQQSGMSLIELMVSMLIGMVLILAATTIMVTLEGARRSMSSTNDIDQAGNYAMSLIDKWVRSAGSGYAQSGSFMFGCPLFAANSGVSPAQVMPLAANTALLNSPFATVNLNFSLIPVLILQNQYSPNMSGQGSDQLVVMSGSSGKGELGVPVSSPPTSGSTYVLNVVTPAPFSPNDVILIGDQQPNASGNLSNCLVSQLSSSTAAATLTTATGYGALTLGTPASGSSFYSAAMATTPGSFSRNGFVFNLGNSVNNNMPSFQLIGVGDNNTLYTFDLLQFSSPALVPRADSVFELHALYGVQATPGAAITWFYPQGTYSSTNLTAGTAAAAQTLQNITAIRIGLILRTDAAERSSSPLGTSPFGSTTATSTITAGPLTLFSDLTCSGNPCTFTRNLSSTTTPAETSFRYRTIEATIPLRNVLIAQ